MEEVIYFLKEWLDSYIVSKELTTKPLVKQFEQRFVYYEWKSNEKDTVFCFGGQKMSTYSRQKIYVIKTNIHINLDICVSLNEYQLLRELDKIVTGYAQFINNHKTDSGYDYSFQLTLENENQAKDLMEMLFDEYCTKEKINV